MALNKEKRTVSLDLLLKNENLPKDTDATPRVLEFQKVILKKRSANVPDIKTTEEVTENGREKKDGIPEGLDALRSPTITRSKGLEEVKIEKEKGNPLAGRLVSIKHLDLVVVDEQFQGIKLKTTKKPDDFDGSTSSLNTTSLGSTPKPTISTTGILPRLKSIKKPDDYDKSNSSLDKVGSSTRSSNPALNSATSALAESPANLSSATSPYGLVRLKTVKKETPVKSPPSSTTAESPFAVTLKSTKKPQDYQEPVQIREYKTKFEQTQSSQQQVSEKPKKATTPGPVKVVKLKDANTVTVTNSSFTPPKLKTIENLNPFIPVSSTLYVLKGHRKIYITPAASLSESDSYVFVDHQKLVIQTWNGASTGAVKKVKSRDYASRFEREFRGALKVVQIERGSASDKEFVERHGMNVSAEDGVWEGEFEKEIKLSKFSEGCDVVGEGRVSCTLLDNNYVFGLEARDGVYIWHGSLSLAQMRDDAKEWAEKIKGSRNVHVQGAQDTLLLFRDKFSDWSEGMSIAVSQTKNIGAADRTWANYHRAQNVGMVKAVDIQRMWLGPEEIATAIVRPKTPVIDKGTLQLQGWKCYETQSIKLIDTELGGVLNAGESYTFKVVYEEDGKVGTAIYYWMGSESNSNMKGHAALLANELDPRRVIKQSRIVQGSETNSFIDVFGESKTIMIVKKNLTEGVRVFQIQETASKRIRIQEQNNATRFHACASFLVLNGDVATIWKSTLHSNDLVSRVYKFLSANMSLHNIKLVDQGSEPSSLWSTLGFPESEQVFIPSYYNQVKSLPIITRLFRISSIKLGNATADEIETPLHQSSFLANGVFILDAYYELYVWLGNEICQSKESKHELIKLALETALEYTDVVKEQESRLDKSNVYLLRQGQEPLSFKSLFLDWKEWSTSEGYYQTLPRSYSFLLNEKKVTDCLSEMSTKKWSLYDLQQMLAQRVPIGLDPKRMQDYLVDNEFQEYLGMERSVFEALPEWRKVAMRKKIGLV